MKQKLLLACTAFFLIVIANAQTPTILNSHITNQSAPVLLQNINANPQLLTTPAVPSLPRNVKKASVKVKLDLGDDYTLGDLGGKAFEIHVRFNLSLGEDANKICNDCELVIFANQPNKKNAIEAVYSGDFTSKFNDPKYQVSNTSNLILTINPKDITYINTDATVIANLLSPNARILFGYDIEYGFDVKGTSVNSTSLSFQPNSKNATFNWSADLFIPNYQFQLLRLYNMEQGRKNDRSIMSTIDWSKALSLETHTGGTNSVNSLNLTLAEGSGFYAWRVRPIGTAFEGGIANNKNYGTWSMSDNPNLTAYDITTASPNIPKDIIYFTDPEDDINNIYSRTFSEGTPTDNQQVRISEAITYANGLQQSKQKQTYLPSKQTLITSQTIYDKSGRPVISTLPVPTNTPGIGLKYKNKFSLDPTSTSIYRTPNFDDNTTYNNPASMNVTDAAAYYGSNNVADAEGYPFTRSLFYNDGTNRVREQSGVGKKHMIGNDADGKGKTVTTLYSTASEYELVRILGKEAPDARSVLKTITTDQNGVSSITYTSKEGKVIATCLSLTDKAVNMDELDSKDKVKDNDYTVEDLITTDGKTEHGKVGSRRLAFNRTTTISGIKYTLLCPKNEQDLGCFNGKVICNYTVQIIITKVDGIPFTDDFKKGFPSDQNYTWGFIQNPQGVSTIASTLTKLDCSGIAEKQFDPITLPEGTYVIEKQLIPLGQTDEIKKNTALINNLIDPLKQLIGKWLDDAKCSKKMNVFFERVNAINNGLIDAFNNAGTLKQNPTQAELDFYYSFYYKLDKDYLDKYGVSNPFLNDDGSPNFKKHPYFNVDISVKTSGTSGVVISASCCKNLFIPVDYIDPFDNKSLEPQDINGNQFIEVNPFVMYEKKFKIDDPNYQDHTEFFPDFEGYAYSYFWDCVSIIDENDYKPNNIVPSTHDKDQRYPAYTLHAQLTWFKDIPKQIINNKEIPGKTAQMQFNEFEQKVTKIYHLILKDQMKGWHTPGTFNSMCYHMLNDKYTTDGEDENLNGITDPIAFPIETTYTNDCGEEITFTDITNEIRTDGKTPRRIAKHYQPDQLFKCWANQLSFLKSKLQNVLDCPEDVIDYNSHGTVAKRVDDEDDKKEDKHNKQYDTNIKANFIIKAIFKRKMKKLSRQVRDLQPEADKPDLKSSNLSFDYVMIKEFLNCTGYQFAKVLTIYDPKPLDNINPALSDINPALSYSVPNKITDPFYKGDINTLQDILDGYNGFTLGPIDPNDPYPNNNRGLQTQVTYSGNPRKGYTPNKFWNFYVGGVETTTSKLRIDTLFKSIKDPIYAFKYYEYEDDSRPQLELLTCYKDPNWRKVYVDPNNNNAPTTADKGVLKAVYLYDPLNTITVPHLYDIDPNTQKPILTGPPSLCNFCGKGYVSCPIVKDQWSSGQRYTFYEMINIYKKPNVIDWNDGFSDPKDFASPVSAVVDQTTEGDTNNEYKLWDKDYVSPDDTPNAISNQVISYQLWEDLDRDPELTTTLSESDYKTLLDKKFIKTDGTRYKTKVELDMDNLNKLMCDNCEAQRNSIRHNLLINLQSKCYVIGGCKLPTDVYNSASKSDQWESDRIVPNEDIDMMVDYMVLECKKHGLVSTYRRVKSGCRDVFTPIWITKTKIKSTPTDPNFLNLWRSDKTVPTDNPAGQYNLNYVDRFGLELITNWVEYGSAKRLMTQYYDTPPNPNPVDPNPVTQATMFWRTDYNNKTIPPFASDPSTVINDLQTTGINSTDIIKIWDVTKDVNNTPAIDDSFTNCEWNKRREVMEYVLLLNMNKNFCTWKDKNTGKFVDNSDNPYPKGLVTTVTTTDNCPVLPKKDNTIADPNLVKAYTSGNETLDIKITVDNSGQEVKTIDSSQDKKK